MDEDPMYEPNCPTGRSDVGPYLGDVPGMTTYLRRALQCSGYDVEQLAAADPETLADDVDAVATSVAYDLVQSAEHTLQKPKYNAP